MRINSAIAIVTMLIIPQIIFAQDTDFGLWTGVALKYKFENDIRLSAGTESRFFSNISRFDKQNYDAGLEYKINDWSNLGGGYRLATEKLIEGGFEYSHRTSIDAEAEKELWRFTISGRARWQAKWSNLYEEEAYRLQDHSLRFKTGQEFKFYASRYTPCSSIELFIPLESKIIDKIRATAGVEVKITKQLAAELSYIFQHEFYGSPNLNEHIIATSVSYKL